MKNLKFTRDVPNNIMFSISYYIASEKVKNKTYVKNKIVNHYYKGDIKNYNDIIKYIRIYGVKTV